MYASINTFTHNRFQSHISNHRIKIHYIGITYMTIIMLGSSYGSKSMKNKREIHQATTTNPQSRGVLLPLHHGDDGGDVGEGGGDPSSGVSPYHIRLALFWYFRVSAALSSRKPREVLYIEVFRSYDIRGRKNQANWTTEEEKSRGDTPTLTGRATQALLALLALLVRSKCFRCFS